MQVATAVAGKTGSGMRAISGSRRKASSKRQTVRHLVDAGNDDVRKDASASLILSASLS